MLLAEKAELEERLSSLGYNDPDNMADWVPNGPDMNVLRMDENEVADEIEEYEENSAILKQIEIRYNAVKRALEKIEEGTYGFCEVTGEEIPTDRLDANPAARTMVEHADEIEQEPVPLNEIPNEPSA